MKEIKVGDVWKDVDGESYIVRVKDGNVSYWWDDGDRPDITTEADDEFLRGHRLLERDGKQYVAPREFKENAFYKVSANGHNCVARYQRGKLCFLTLNNEGIYKAPELLSEHWNIGEELKIEWPDV